MQAQRREMRREKEEEQNGQKEPQKSTEEGLSKEIETMKQIMIKLEETDLKHREEVAKLKKLSLAQQNQTQEQMKALTQENTELKGKVASLGEAKDAQEKEASHWKAEYDKQRAATEEEMCQFKVQESNRVQKDYDRWVLMMTEMQNKVAAKEGEISQYIGKYNHLQNELQRMQKEWIKSKGEASKLAMKNAQHQEEKVKYEQEVRDLKQEMSAKCTEWEEERNLYTENVTVLGEKVDSLERENSSLLKKEQEYEAALRTSKDSMTCLISERDSCQEEIKKLKKDKETLKENMVKLGRERDNHQMELHVLGNKSTQLLRLQEQINTLLLDIDKLKREAEQQEEAARLRQEIDNSKEEANQLKRREETELTRLREERDKYEEEAEQLKRRAETVIADHIRRKSESELIQMSEERDQYKEEMDQLNRRPGSYQEKASKLNWAESKITELQQERDDLKRQVDNFKWIQQIRGERDEYKQEVDRLKSQEATWEKQMMDLKREMDEYKKSAGQLQMVPERGSSRNREEKGDGVMAEAGPRVDTQPNRDPGNFQAPPTHPQPHTSRVVEEEEVVVTQGLPNLGNTCYINSVVQCLYHLLPLRNTLNSNISRLHYHPGTRVALALAEHFMAMQNATEKEVCLTIGALKRVLGSYDASFGGREQQEAHDLFTALVSCLQSDLSQHDGPDTFPSASSLFGGQLETSIVCLETSTPLTYTSEAFTSLSLPVVGSNTWRLKDLLDKHFQEQKKDWDCEHCHFTHKCSHSTHIRRCPPLLVIHFNRVSHFNSSTWKTKVKFPVAGLSLQGYVARDAPRSPQYQLVGVVCHVGSMASGHYTAYCRYRSGRRSRKWRVCNDSQVWDVEERRVLEDETAHMLFYVQQGS